jgi:phosphohistidine phosphatase
MGVTIGLWGFIILIIANVIFFLLYLYDYENELTTNMKELYLMRHAKSSWKENNIKDFDRPLNKRGKADAPFMGEILKNLQVKPDAILSSSALRTTSTALMVAESLQFAEKNIIFDKRIYEAGDKALIKIIKEIPPHINSLMLIGHNPGLTELANMLTDSYVYNVPTSGVYAIRFPFYSWEYIGDLKGDFYFFEYPKKHKTK